jgi:hypothetical protein
VSSHFGQKIAWEEGIAIGLLLELGDPTPPINAFELARACGLRVVSADIRHAQLMGNVIRVNTRAMRVRQHGMVAHELGHWALARAAEPQSEEAADMIGAALLLPRREFDADLRTTGWDLRLLQAKHVNCSAELIARRIVSLRDACVAIWDNGKLKARVASPWLPAGFARISGFERELAADVLASGSTTEQGNLLWGFAVFSGAWKRVITVCEAEQLALRY